MPSNVASGTQTATVGTVHDLSTVSVAGNYLLKINGENLDLGDSINTDVYDKVLTGSNLVRVFPGTYGNILSSPGIQSIPLSVVFQMKATLQQINANFTVTSMTGTVAVDDIVTGATSGATGKIRFMDNAGTPTAIRIQWLSGTWQDGENAEVDGSNFLTLNDATPDLSFEWAITDMS